MEEDAADGLRSVTDSILTDTEPDGAENDPYGRIGYPRPRHRTPVHARDPAIGSVLTRSEERVQRRRAVALLARRKGFQSSPAPKSGCNRSPPNTWGARWDVSILTRSEERVQRWDRRTCQPAW